MNPSEWEISVIDSPEINVTVLPSANKIIVFGGMLSISHSEAGLATILSHQLAHAIARILFKKPFFKKNCFITVDCFD